LLIRTEILALLSLTQLKNEESQLYKEAKFFVTLLQNSPPQKPKLTFVKTVGPVLIRMTFCQDNLCFNKDVVSDVITADEDTDESDEDIEQTETTEDPKDSKDIQEVSSLSSDDVLFLYRLWLSEAAGIHRHGIDQLSSASIPSESTSRFSKKILITSINFSRQIFYNDKYVIIHDNANQPIPAD